MGNQECDTRDGGNSAQGRGKAPSRKVVIVGAIALLAGGLCTIGTLTGHATYINERAAHNAMLQSVAFGVMAFLFLGYAWHVLGRDGRVCAMIIGIANLVLLVPIIVDLVRLH